MKLRYTPRALAELDEILTYVAERSPQGARRIQARIQSIATLLLRYPYSGQRTSVDRMRRIGTTPFHSLIFYEVTVHEVIIIGLRHAARDPASMPAGERS